LTIYTYFAQKLGCYESDLRLQAGQYWNLQTVEDTPAGLFPAEEWNALLTYTFSQPLQFETAEQAKRYLADYLKAK